jgi:hypothetical protein
MSSSGFSGASVGVVTSASADRDGAPSSWMITALTATPTPNSTPAPRASAGDKAAIGAYPVTSLPRPRPRR